MLTSSGETHSATTCRNGFAWDELSACMGDDECLRCLFSTGADGCSTSSASSASFGLDCGEESVAWYCCILREEACSSNPHFVALAGKICALVGDQPR